jgi:hypothetical protein
MHFYVFKMAASIVFVFHNAVEAIYIFFGPSHDFLILE